MPVSSAEKHLGTLRCNCAAQAYCSLRVAFPSTGGGVHFNAAAQFFRLAAFFGAFALGAQQANRLPNIADLKVNEPLNVNYPDGEAPGVLLKLGIKVPGGVGADGDVVGFSTTCPHKGLPADLQLR